MTALPINVFQYLQATENDDIAASVAAFAPEAIVTDDGRTHIGTDRIRAWRERSRSGGEFEYTRSFRCVESTAESTFTARFRVTGNFPGSPVDLNYLFRLDAAGRIEGLDITA